MAVALATTAWLAPAAARAAEEKPAAPAASTPTGVMYSNLTTVTAKVEAVDLEKRLVTVRGPKGNVVEIEAGPEVRNLPQVKVGDMVVVKYQESIAFDLKKEAGAPEAAAAGLVARADEGAKPAAGGARVIVADVVIQAIDPKTMMVTVKGPKGNIYDVKARDPKRLETIKVGDQVRVTYTEALAVSVEEAAH
jgi:Cu/Ag efflux protein CusF